MIVLLTELKDVKMLFQGFFGRITSGINAGKHLVFGIPSPIGTGNAEKFEVLEIRGIRNVRPAAEVDEIPLFVKRNRSFEFLDMFNLVVIGFKDFAGFLLGNFFSLVRNGFLGEFFHLRFNGGEVFFGDRAVAEVDVIVEPFFDGGSKTKEAAGI